MVFHYKPSILGYPYFWKHPYIFKKKNEAPEPEKHKSSEKTTSRSAIGFSKAFWHPTSNNASETQNPFFQEGERTQVTHLQGHVQGPHNEWGPHLVERGHSFSWGKFWGSTLPPKRRYPYNLTIWQIVNQMDQKYFETHFTKIFLLKQGIEYPKTIRWPLKSIYKRRTPKHPG